jgi:hypothetical protein
LFSLKLKRSKNLGSSYSPPPSSRSYDPFNDHLALPLVAYLVARMIHYEDLLARWLSLSLHYWTWRRNVAGPIRYWTFYPKKKIFSAPRGVAPKCFTSAQLRWHRNRNRNRKHSSAPYSVAPRCISSVPVALAPLSAACQKIRCEPWSYPAHSIQHRT